MGYLRCPVGKIGNIKLKKIKNVEDIYQVMIDDFREKKLNFGVVYGELTCDYHGFDNSLSKISHHIEDLFIDHNNELVAYIKLLNTNRGRELDQNKDYKLSARCAGKFNKGIMILNKFFTFDIIYERTEAQPIIQTITYYEKYKYLLL